LKEINTKLPPIQESIKNFYKSLDIINKLIKKNKEIITNIMHWKNPINSDSRKNRINFSEKDEELLGGRFKDKFSMFEENFQRNKIEVNIIFYRLVIRIVIIYYYKYEFK